MTPIQHSRVISRQILKAQRWPLRHRPIVPLGCAGQSSPRRGFSTSPQLATTSNSSSPSVDPSEVSHFNALASSWWDPHGPSRLLHLMNPVRQQFIGSCLAQTSTIPSAADKKLRYLDIGCGGGIFAESAARLPHTASVTAIDPTPEVLAVAQAHRKTDPLLTEPGRLEYKNISIEQLPQPKSESDQYDVVTLFEVLEHVTTPSAFLEQILPHVKPGGWFVCSTIARTWTSWFTTKLVAEEIIGIVPKGTHEWSKYVNEAELREWFVKQPGWDMPRSMGVVYVPGLGWKEVPGSQDYGNYFFGIHKVAQ